MGKRTESKGRQEPAQEKKQVIKSDQEKIKTETRRLKRILNKNNVSPENIELMDSLIDNAAWMKIKLDGARDAIKSTNVVIPYDNGGGQKGIKENPLFKGYEALLKSYMSSLRMIMDVLPANNCEVKEQELEKPKTMLELVRNKHKKEA